MSHTGLILYSHGSLLCGADSTLYLHAERIRAKNVFLHVEVGFLNYNHPTIAEAVENQLNAGCTDIVVVPYFLVPGRFVTRDLPEALRKVEERHPEINITIAEPIGYDAALAEAVRELTCTVVDVNEFNQLSEKARMACKGDPLCPLYGVKGCPKKEGERQEAPTT